MSGQRQTATRGADDPFGSDFSNFAPQADRQALAVSGGAKTDQAMADAFVAVRCPIKRDIGRVRDEALTAAGAMGAQMFYRWEVENRRQNRMEVIQGASIKCAMVAAQMYGNCRVEAFPAQETPDHWVFMARFVDFERGTTIIRSFQQRRAQNIGGKMDGARAMDLVFQIGQSKAIRNVVVAALGWLTEEMVAEAQKGMLEKVKKNPEGARRRLVEIGAELGIGVERLVRAVGRAVDAWTVQHMVWLQGRLASVQDGMATAEEMFPTSAQADDEDAAAAGQEPTTAPAHAATPVAEPAPAAEAQQPTDPKLAPAARRTRRAAQPAPEPASDAPPPPPADADELRFE